MAKAFNLLSKTTVNTKDKNKKEIKKATVSKTDKKNVEKTKTVKKRGRPTKDTKVTEVKAKTSKVTKPTKVAKTSNTTKSTKPVKTSNPVKSTKVNKSVKTVEPKETTKSIKTNKQDNTSRRWHNLTTNVPEEFRPLEFNSNYKYPIFGYKLPHGIITNTPYYLNKYKQEKGYIEWQYISGCSNLSKCPREFPDCTNCDIYKRRMKELKKNA